MTTINEENKITLHRCKGCNTIELDPDNHCDFCDVSWCDTCIPEEISFRKCYTCNTKWCCTSRCYFNGRYTDYKCVKIKRHSRSCNNCGL